MPPSIVAMKRGNDGPGDVPPWQRPAPPRAAQKARKLSAAQRDAARLRAEQAGRRYPNLVDNMWALRHVPPDDTPSR